MAWEPMPDMADKDIGQPDIVVDPACVWMMQVRQERQSMVVSQNSEFNSPTFIGAASQQCHGWN